MTTTPAYWGSEFDADTTQDGFTSVVTGLTNGGFVVVWIDYEGDGPGNDSVGAQVYDYLGNKVGGEITVNTTSAGAQLAPSVAALAGGDFIVTWEDESASGGDTSGDAVRARRFNGDGTPVDATDFLVNTTTTGNQSGPSVASFADGSFVVAYSDSSGNDILARRYDTAGSPIGNDFIVNVTTVGVIDAPRVATMANGNFAIAYYYQGVSGDTDVRLRVYDSTGAAVGGEILANTTTTGNQNLSDAVGLSGAGFVVVWDSASGIVAQRFDNSGNKVGGEISVNTSTAGSQIRVKMTALNDGGFFITWSDDSAGTSDSNAFAVIGQRFAADGTKVGGEVQVNFTEAGNQWNMDVGTLADGRIVSGYSTLEVYGRILDPRGTTITGTSGPDAMTSREDGASVFGFGGDDILSGRDDDDTLNGAAGNDILIGGFGLDTMQGGTQNDIFRLDVLDIIAGEVIDGDQDTDTIELTEGGNYRLDLATILDMEALTFANPAATDTVARLDWNQIVPGGLSLNSTITGNPQAGVQDTLDIRTSFIAAIDLSGFTFVDWGNGGDIVSVLGNANSETFLGSGVDDTIDGAGGNDLLDGGVGGDDTLDGGADTDTVSYASAPGAVKVDLNVQGTSQDTTGAGNDTLISIENLVGSNFDDILTGDGGNNVIDGLGGADEMAGGGGNDNYTVDNPGDIISEGTGEGFDRAFSSVTYVLSANVENLSLLGSGDINATGNAAINTLVGTSGNNILDGMSAADTMVGGDGNDTYVVDNTGDIVSEAPGEGDDQVNSYVGFTLFANLEHLSLLGSSDINGIGNAEKNTIIGNSGNNTIDGLTGNDNMVGGDGDDIFVVDDPGDVVSDNPGPSGGTDQVNSSVSFALVDHIENLSLLGAANINAVGNTLANVLIGNAGNNTLDGLGGADTMVGNGGDDVYVVDNAGDVVSESPGGGTDQVNSSVSFVLFANIEHLSLLGSGNIDATGNELANNLFGNSGDNIIGGNGGDDLIVGNGGDDMFLYADGSGNDTITDFSAGAGVGDRLNVAAFGFADFSAVLAATSDTGGGALVQLDGDDSVTLAGVLKADLVADDFILS